MRFNTHLPPGSWLYRAVFLCLLVSETAFAIDPRVGLDQLSHDTWTSRDGLPDGPILSILESEEGDLWIGTQSALLRFDGRRFVSFEAGKNGLKQYSFVRDLLQTPDSSIWSALVGGVAQRSSSGFQFFDQENGLPHPFVYALAEDPAGGIVIGTGGSGLWRLHQGLFSRLRGYDTDRFSSQINDLVRDPEGTLWVGTDAGVVRLSEPPRIISTGEGLPSAVVNVLTLGENGDIWVGTQGGLALISGNDVLSFGLDEGLAEGHVSALLKDSQGTLWVGTQDGSLQRIHAGSLSVRDSEFLPAIGEILSIYEDMSQNLWLGTEGGLHRYRGGIFRPIGHAQGFSDEDILNLQPRSKGGVWALDASGALLLLWNDTLKIVLPSGSVKGRGMLGLAETEDGALWIGGASLLRYFDGELQRFDNPGGEFTTLLSEGSSLLVAQTAEDGESIVSSFSEGHFTRLPVSAPLRHVQRLKKDRDGHLWISTGGSGVIRYEGSHTVAFTTTDGLPHNICYGLVQDNQGAMWVATRAGLARIRDRQVQSFAEVDGSPTRSPVHLHLDQGHHLWVTADDAIYRLDLSALRDAAQDSKIEVTARRFTARDGIPGSTISWRSSAQGASSDGRLWYATNKGLLVVDPEAIPALPPPPPVTIETLRVDGRQVATSQAEELPAESKRILIRYRAPSLSKDDLVFRYRLVGYDKDWIDAGSERVAHYTNVPGGRYEFQVQVHRQGASQQVSSTKVSLRVMPHFSELWFVRLSLSVLTALGLWAAYFLRVRHLVDRELQLTSKVAERTESLRLEINERRNAESEVRQLNELLEGRVASRTIQLTKTNRALADEKERLSVSLSSLSEGVITTDETGRISLVNPVAEACLEQSAAALLGSPVSDVFRVFKRSDNTPLIDPITQVLTEPSTSEERATKIQHELNEAILTSPSGTARLIDVSAASIVDEEANLAGAVLVFRDITERTRVREELRRTEKLEAVGVLAGGIAHDFNNLLTGIFGYIQLALRKSDDGSQEEKWLTSAMNELENARGLSGQLLTFASGGTPSLGAHSLVLLVQESASFVLSGSSIAKRLTLPDSVWECEIDPQQLRRALDNLLLNARQAMKGEGLLKITAVNLDLSPPSERPEHLEPGLYVELVIEDDGPGMNENVCEHAFDPFFTTRSKGSGLGLASVQSIIQRHGGSIELSSSLGKGTRFRLLLPAAHESLKRAASQAPPHSSDLGNFPGRVLIMDDEETIRDLAQLALTEAGYEVACAEEGQRALDLFKSAQKEGLCFDLAVLDLTIVGGMGGYETLARLRALDPNILVISSSGYVASLPPGSERTFFNATLPKPYILSDLVKIVRTTIAQQRDLS